MLVLNPDTYRSIIRPLLFRLEPETAQRAAEFALKRKLLWRVLSPALSVEDPRLRVDLCGLSLANPVGLAAGFDKDCQFLSGVATLGFGYVVGGTVTESPRQGNRRPRLLRYIRERSLINSLGFPSRGLEFVARQLERSEDLAGQTPVIVSVSGVTVEEILHCHRRLEPLVDAIEVNISSPNTAGLRAFQEPDALAGLLGRLNDQRNHPLFVKLPPYASIADPPSGGSEANDRVLSLARTCVEQGVDALTVANSRPARDTRLAVGEGGLSGRLVFADMLGMVADVRAEVGQRAAINACGGIFTGEDAWQALQAGATTVQLLTGLIYRGPGIVGQINRELLALMDRQRVSSLVPQSQPSLRA